MNSPKPLPSQSSPSLSSSTSASVGPSGPSGASSGASGTTGEELPRFIGTKPVLALKRFANDLDSSSNPDATRFKELNRSRVDNFIKKPIEETAKLHAGFHPPNEPYQRNGLYDYSDHTQHQSLHLDAPELQRLILFFFFVCLNFVSLDH